MTWLGKGRKVRNKVELPLLNVSDDEEELREERRGVREGWKEREIGRE